MSSATDVPNQVANTEGGPVEDGSIPLKRQELLKWNGWGYKDSKFELDVDKQVFSFTGNRYKIGNKKLPLFFDFVQKKLDVELEHRFPSQTELLPGDFSEPLITDDFLNELKLTTIKFSLDGHDRLFRAHGHTLHDVITLRQGRFQRLPDIVVWPSCHKDVVHLVQLANKFNTVIIPFGGGTSVTGSLECPHEEKRTIVSLDTSQMNKTLWIDHENLTARFESGIIGVDLEARLAKVGLCTGHEPDSYEFSSLGGWVATRASGMKKNIYGNIEDLLVHVTFVTSKGVIERNCHVPRLSAGPDVHHFILGSEGTLGVVTEVTLKVRPVPEVRKYGSIIFPSFEPGVKFMREIARQRLTPASVRFMDNEQFIFGQSLKPEADSIFSTITDKIKKLYITAIKRFDVGKMCVATLLFEGSEEQVELLEEKVLAIATNLGGISAGEENGQRGYMMTFVIAYIRDIGLDFGIVAESFETSVPWDKCSDLCRNVKERVRREAVLHKLRKPVFVTCRVTQAYDCGAAVYFYFAFNYQNGFHDDAIERDPVKIYEKIENAARDEILSNGGSISHHHGIGKIRKRWLEQTVSTAGLGMMRAIKEYVDPKNVFKNGNLMIDETETKSSLLKSKL
ncbi:Alkyldihydroxyacetonephosphate synthase, peroxisomal [Halotydeus destructor]|nr:Alkyldihydroxyacetonephosphate synthase, peroxisomal [Halotydeus destructor]